MFHFAFLIFNLVFGVTFGAVSSEIYNLTRLTEEESLVQELATTDLTTSPSPLSDPLTTSASNTRSDSSNTYPFVTFISTSNITLPVSNAFTTGTSYITSPSVTTQTSLSTNSSAMNTAFATTSSPVTSVNASNFSNSTSLPGRTVTVSELTSPLATSISTIAPAVTFVSTSPMTPFTVSSASTSSPITSTTTSTITVTSSVIASTMNTTSSTSTQVPEDEDLCDTLNTLYKELKARFKKQGKMIRVTEEVCDSYVWDKAIRESERVCSNKRVIGGRTVYPDEYLHMGAIGWEAVFGNWIFKCGSTLISTRFVVTAAHCTYTGSTEVADPSPKVIRFSDRSISDEGEDRNGREIKPTDILIKNIIVHPQYKAPKKCNDIALIELREILTIRNHPNLFPACIWHESDTTALGTKATVTGWGADKPELRILSEISPKLRVATLDLIDSKKCDELLRPLCNRHFDGVYDTQICAGKLSGGVDSCQGDSGGPLQVLVNQESKVGLNLSLYYIIGVTSFGFKCGLPNTPGVYTRVSAYLDWIEEIVWPEKIKESIDIRSSAR